MKQNVLKIEVPGNSEISNQLSGAHFFDSYKIPIVNGERSALDIYLEVVSKTPEWINMLMALRNKIVSIVGLKNLGHLGEIDQSKTGKDYYIGDRVGIFSILSLSDQEVILGDSDKHLNARVSVCKLNEGEYNAVAISTVVYINNMLGRIYMLFVTPLHKLIAPAMLRLVDVSDSKT